MPASSLRCLRNLLAVTGDTLRHLDEWKREIELAARIAAVSCLKQSDRVVVVESLFPGANHSGSPKRTRCAGKVAHAKQSFDETQSLRVRKPWPPKKRAVNRSCNVGLAIIGCLIRLRKTGFNSFL